MSQSATEWPVAQPLTSLEQRVNQLESAVALLQDTQALEERVAERVVQHLQGAASTKSEPMPTTERATVSPEAAAAIAESALRAASPSIGQKLTGVPWLLLDLYREAVSIFRMFVDLNYKVAWSTRVFTLLLLPAILLSRWWVPFAQVPFVGDVIDKLVDLALAFVMFKALSREAQKYRDTRRSSGG